MHYVSKNVHRVNPFIQFLLVLLFKKQGIKWVWDEYRITFKKFEFTSKNTKGKKDKEKTFDKKMI